MLRALFADQRGRRIITSSFASHIHRIQQIADAAIASGRVVATLGMSIKKNVRLARDLGLLTIPDASLIDIEEVDRLAPEQVCIISTGSQGEPMSALGLMASGENRWLKVGEHDTVILSSPAIPGNEFNVNRVIGARAGRRAEDPAVDHEARVLRAHPRRVPAHGGSRQAGGTDGYPGLAHPPLRGR